ncbi:hypothetical protein HW555_011608 [Spodoptera exigua]|uniref:Alpha-ketoglutarate-dependent dioxygenase AlkB-like domain-containing protein n=1 Tax=Spodoptera exigua TaxID=7107 RepID=A0A835G7E3_SPOEX|nr:hypothetical protein HW555_011608 [Spodoptera exigua]
MPRRSLIIIYGEARYNWEHSVLREDIASRRGNLPPPYLNGDQQEIGNTIRKIGQNFWDHKGKKYNSIEPQIPNDKMGVMDIIKSPGISPLIGQNKKVENQIA